MQSILRSLHGKQVRIDQFSEVSVAGLLVNVQSDYVSIWSSGKEITHYPLSHIKAVTTDVTQGIQEIVLPALSFPSSFTELIESLMLSKVRIENGEGARIGILSEMSDDNVTLVVETKHVAFYPISKIKNISPIFKVKEEQTTTGDGGSSTTQSSSNGAQTQQTTSDGTSTANSGTTSSKSAANQTANNEAKTSQNQKHQTADVGESKNSETNKSQSTAKPMIFRHKLAKEMLGVLDSSQKKSSSSSKKQTGSSVVHVDDDQTALNLMIGKGSRRRPKNTKSG